MNHVESSANEAHTPTGARPLRLRRSTAGRTLSLIRHSCMIAPDHKVPFKGVHSALHVENSGGVHLLTDKKTAEHVKTMACRRKVRSIDPPSPLPDLVLPLFQLPRHLPQRLPRRKLPIRRRGGRRRVRTLMRTTRSTSQAATKTALLLLLLRRRSSSRSRSLARRERW